MAIKGGMPMKDDSDMTRPFSYAIYLKFDD